MCSEESVDHNNDKFTATKTNEHNNYTKRKELLCIGVKVREGGGRGEGGRGGGGRGGAIRHKRCELGCVV